jgi:hypothetical protein
MLTKELLDEIEMGQGETLARLARLIQPVRQGRPTSQSCLFRWVMTGVRGPDGERVFLEAARLSGKWISTPGAIRRFVAAQTPRLEGEAAQESRTPNRRRRANEMAARELENMGV